MLLACAPQAATAAPLPIRSASLRQDGQQLVWHLVADRRFTVQRLTRDHQAVCLLIERVRSGVAVRQVCLRPPAPHGHAPRLLYTVLTRTGAGRAHALAATVTRASRSELTAAFLPGDIGIGYRSIRWQVSSAEHDSTCGTAQTCQMLYPSRPHFARLHTPRLVGCVPSGAPFVYNGPSSPRQVALTFDDGPWYDTPQFLDILEREHVPATFFQIGEQIGTYGAAVDRRMLADGDIIGDHTWSHANVSGGGSYAASQISQAAYAIRQITGGFQPCLFRAPGGAVSNPLIAEARSMGFTTIQWDVDPRDWSRPGTDVIYNNVIANTHSGSIVLQHDGGGDRSQTLAALPREIDTLRREGFQFVTVTQLLGQRLIYK